MAAGSERAGITPLGTVSIDRPVVERLIEARLIGVLDVAHAQEHSLEVQLAGGCAEEGQLSLVSMAPLIVQGCFGNRGLSCRGTKSSNPLPSSAESANHRFLQPTGAPCPAEVTAN